MMVTTLSLSAAAQVWFNLVDVDDAGGVGVPLLPQFPNLLPFLRLTIKLQNTVKNLLMLFRTLIFSPCTQLFVICQSVSLTVDY